MVSRPTCSTALEVPRESNPATALWASTSTPFTTGSANQHDQRSANSAVCPYFPGLPGPNNSIGPSVGFAYSPQWGGFLTGNGKTVIRGGYRLLYDPPFYNIYLNMSSSAPNVFTQIVHGRAVQLQTACRATNGAAVRGAYHPSWQMVYLILASSVTLPCHPNFGPDKVHSWTLGIERELSKNSALEVRYVGNKGQNLFQSVNGNPVGELVCNPTFPNLVPAGVTACPAASAVVAACCWPRKLQPWYYPYPQQWRLL